jgi:Ca-activated chloride channel family protein
MMQQVDDLKLGALILIPQQAGTASPLPLEHTAVNGTITGPVASVTVTQRFGNPFNHPIELEYLFPLPEKGAVVDYEITIGTRTIKADIKERETARQVYQQAVAAGKRASLLEQRRPNLFSIEIGNVQPGETITTKLTYEDRLKYSDGSYQFVFPMGITPKYHTPGTAQGEVNAVDSPVELDNSKISKVEIMLAVDAGVAVGEPRSRTHPVSLKRKNDREFGLTLEGNQIPNKDFVLEYAVAEEHLQTAVWSSHDDDGSDTVLVTLLPPKLDISAEPPAREFIFVIDRSGSMSRDPMEQAKNALRACIRALGEQDTFTIAAFDNATEWFSNTPVAVTQENINQADAWINQIHSRGGTEILGALQQAMAIHPDNERQRYLVFLTDGAVSAEDRVLKEIAAKRGNARFFSFGIGPSVNRYLLNKMAEIGRGTADFMGANDDIEGMMTRFQDKVSYPALLDIQVSWQGAESWDAYPAVLPDVYAGEPLELTTRLARQGRVTLNVSGKRNNQPVTMSVEIPKTENTNPTLRRIWARARVESLQDEHVHSGDAEKIRQQIISLGLAHRLVTRHTSFVAVDSEVTESTTDSEKINVSVPLPDGLDPAGFGLGAPPVQAAYYSMAAPSPAQPIFDPNTRLRGIDISPKAKKSEGIVNRLVGSVKSLLGGDKEDKEEELVLFSKTSSDVLSQSIPDEIPDWLQEQRDTRTQPEPAPISASTEDRIKWLARTQNVNGSWHDDMEMTAAAVLAFVRAGHTTRAGNYRQQVKRAASYLSKQLQLGRVTGFALFAAVRALDELHAVSGDFAVSDVVRSTLPNPASDAERAAVGEGTAPNTVSTLDDVRVKALLEGAAVAPQTLTQGVDSQRVQAWLAVGKP